MINWDYIAGFFDADGSIYQSGKYWRISFTNNEKDVLDDIYKFLKDLSVNVKMYDKKVYESKDTSIELRINAQRDVGFVVEHLLAYSHIGYKIDRLNSAWSDIYE